MFRKVFLLLFFLFSALFLSGCLLKKAPAALQINSTPTANVFVDGKLLGKTPFSSDTLNEGEVTVKLIPESTAEALPSWEGKIKLSSGILTLIEREFFPSENTSSMHILSLEKTKEKETALLSVVSEPDSAAVAIDGQSNGFSPLTLDNIPAGDHEVILTKENYLEKKLRVKNVVGYRLLINAKLGEIIATPTPTPAETETTGKKKPTSTVTPKAKASPSASGTKNVLVKETETGFLRVRSAPKSGAEVARVKPGEKYPYIESNSDDTWYKIAYQEGKEGWISAQYAELVE